MKINFGIIGCGYIAQRHAEHIAQHPEANLTGAYDIKPERTQNFAQKNKVLGFKRLKDLLHHPDIDIVTVCTPNGNHHLSAIAALSANKHVLVEKPMSTKKVYCEEMIYAALNHNRQLYVVKQNRYNPPVQAVKKLIEQNKLGKLYSLVLNCYWNRNEKYYQASDWKGSKDLDGGILFNQFSHFIDILYYLFGDVKVLSGAVDNFAHQHLTEYEDSGNFIFRFEKSGALGCLNATISAYQKNMEGSITVFAENATIKIGGKYLNTIDYQMTNGFDIQNLPASNPANNYGYYEGSMSNHDKVIDNVVQTLNGREKIMTNAYEGLKVVEIIENMYVAALR